MLSLVEEGRSRLAERRGDTVDLTRITFDDRRVYDRIHEGDTVGVFQIESRAQAQMLPRTRPDNLDDLTVQVAIVRPGPIVGGAINPYVKHREELRADPNTRPKAPHEILEEVLEETYGVVLFQEQVVLVAMTMGGMSGGEAERFRRSLSRHDAKLTIGHYQERFMRGAAERNVPRETAEKVFEGLKGFASFGFPKSHAAAFALLA